MTIFIISSIFLTLTLGVLAAVIFTSNIENKVVQWIVGTIIAIIVGFLFPTMVMLDNEADKKNGIRESARSAMNPLN